MQAHVVAHDRRQHGREFRDVHRCFPFHGLNTFRPRIPSAKGKGAPERARSAGPVAAGRRRCGRSIPSIRIADRRGFSLSMTGEFAWVGQLVSEPVCAVDAGDRLALRKIHDEPAAVTM